MSNGARLLCTVYGQQLPVPGKTVLRRHCTDLNLRKIMWKC